MDRRLLFPAIAATAWAQQPAQPNAEALRDRVQQYYQLMVEKKYRQAEAMVADQSKDEYYAGRKPDIKAYEVTAIDFLTDATARVTIKAKLLMLMPGAGAQLFDFPTPTYWKIENGLWCWYVPEEVKASTPFGKMVNNGASDGSNEMKGAAPGTLTNPDVGALVNKIGIDRISVILTEKDPEQVVTITNGLPGPMDLTLDPHVKMIKGLSVKVEPSHLEGGAKATITLRRTGADRIADYVAVTAEPFNRVFNIQVRSQ